MKKARGNKAGKRKIAARKEHTFPGYQTKGSGKGKKKERKAFSYGKGKGGANTASVRRNSGRGR